ncbi:protein kinase domain-containing protein [Rhodococcus koreensis]
MTEGDPLRTQRDATAAVVAELNAAGFEDAQEIGHGGFGVVYRCTQPTLERTVAVKVLTADLDEGNRARFFREQRAMGRLTGHPNIVNVLHVGTLDSGRPYIVMQYHAQDSLELKIRRHGPLGFDEALQLGVKIAGALETAHRLEILHRDVKPANILLTDYGEPVLTDFGIAHISGGFETSTGTVTGSPAYTAPEVLSGAAPSTASDIYGLGATMFCAVTGHAAFERHSGEQVVAQFLRITTQPVPDLREQGIPEDMSSIIERAMSADPGARHASAAAFGDELRQIQSRNGFPVDEMALLTRAGVAADAQDPHRGLAARSVADRPLPSTPSGVRSSVGNLPIDLTSFIGRRRELTEAREKLSVSRLLTLTGIGGVGKTRLGLRLAADVRRGFADGVWLVALSELRDESLLVDVVAAALGVRDRVARSLEDVLIEFLNPRQLLLMLDNCEHVVDSAAALVETLLRTCPDLRILTTSREPLGIGGETVLRVPPLTLPDPDRVPSLRGLPQYDGVTLFSERAAAAVPGFELTEDNRETVARICQQLDGLPLPIELAATRLRAMTAEQILDRITDRFRFLTLGSRRAPARQQTLRLSMDWSYELCTVPEQQVWARLSVFAGSFELDAAQDICAKDLAPEDLLDIVTSLVDKSILIREDAGAVVRFRMLKTLRDYGREISEHVGEYQSLRRQHHDWYQQLALKAEAEWISPRQLERIARINREQSNLREAMEFALLEAVDAGLRIAAALTPFWLARGQLNEGRRWLDRALARKPGEANTDRVKALYNDSTLAQVQGDLPAGTALLEEAQFLGEHLEDPVLRGHIAVADGFLALYNGDLPRACSRLEGAREDFGANSDLYLQVSLLQSLGWVYELQEKTTQAIICHEQVLTITEAHGESVHRSYSLWAMAIAVWRQGDPNRAVQLLNQCLRLTRLVDDPLTTANCLESLAWIASDQHSSERAAILMGAAEALGRAVGTSTVLIPHLLLHHKHYDRLIRRSLSERAFEAASRKGHALGLDESVAYALVEQPQATPTPPGATTNLTKREQQVADLVAQGLTNKAIATRLVISQRTAQGHVEHILTKLGFSSRAQIAAWVVEQTRDDYS